MDKLQVLRDQDTTRDGGIAQQILTTAESARDESARAQEAASANYALAQRTYWSQEQANNAREDKLVAMMEKQQSEMAEMKEVMQKVTEQQEEQTAMLQDMKERMQAVQQGVAATRKLVRICVVMSLSCTFTG